jgi:hypothetical protein
MLVVVAMLPLLRSVRHRLNSAHTDDAHKNKSPANAHKSSENVREEDTEMTQAFLTRLAVLLVQRSRDERAAVQLVLDRGVRARCASAVRVSPRVEDERARSPLEPSSPQPCDDHPDIDAERQDDGAPRMRISNNASIMSGRSRRMFAANRHSDVSALRHRPVRKLECQDRLK